MAAAKRSAPAGSPSKSSADADGTPSRSGGAPAARWSIGSALLQGSAVSGDVRAAIATAAAAVSTSRANTDTQSTERQAGTTPAVLTRPRVGLSPTMPLQAAG